MTNVEKAKINLAKNNIYTTIENGELYVNVGDKQLELSEFEIDFQASEYDKAKEYDFPYNKGDSYWVIEPMEECDGKFDGITAIECTWDNISEDSHEDDKEYFNDKETILKHVKDTYNFIKVFPIGNNSPYMLLFDKEKGKFYNPDEAKLF